MIINSNWTVGSFNLSKYIKYEKYWIYCMIVVICKICVDNPCIFKYISSCVKKTLILPSRDSTNYQTVASSHTQCLDDDLLFTPFHEWE